MTQTIIKKSFFYITSFLFLPTLLFAQSSSHGTLADFIYGTLIGKIITPITGLVVGLIIMFFFFNSATYLFKGNKSSEERKKIMISLMWSVIILFILVSVWGIVKIIAGTFSLETVI